MGNEVRNNLKYTDTHEWVKLNGETAHVGITDHAQSELTDIVFVELPEVGKEVKKGDELCVVESVKSVSEIYAPVSGKIANINKKLEETPETINESPYDEGWLVEIELTNKSEIDKLLDVDSYKKLI
ncbi:MAG: glycine cleavage system protein H [Thermoplasmata archaeon M9B1D]|jgi:glycine cleavage system H protein|nr:MAG: glycine cleavage system protein H [Thermoplasmata archaeon M9B1D]PNX51777.1 MAG: glycine cleavage system protein H [Thermoplasmata archaeon M8B2D]